MDKKENEFVATRRVSEIWTKSSTFRGKPQDLRRRNLQNFRRVYNGFTHDSRTQVYQSRQTHKKWKADSTSMEHAPQFGLGLRHILWRWLFRQQCPAISETKILSLFLDKFSKYLVTLNLGCEINCLDCRQPETSAQLRECAWIATLSYFAEQLRLIVVDMALVHKKLIHIPALPAHHLCHFQRYHYALAPKRVSLSGH
jgi:hypothetical protein